MSSSGEFYFAQTGEIYIGVDTLCVDGKVYSRGGTSGPIPMWRLEESIPPVPVPLESIADWMPEAIFTHDQEHWILMLSATDEFFWTRIGGQDNRLICVPPVDADAWSFGRLKSLFR